MIKGPGVDRLGREGGAFVLGMSGLSTDSALGLALRRWRLGRLDDVGGRGLGGGRGVLAGRGQLLAQSGDDLLEGGEFGLQGLDSRLQPSAIGAVGQVLGSPGGLSYRLRIWVTTTVNGHAARNTASAGATSRR